MAKNSSISSFKQLPTAFVCSILLFFFTHLLVVNNQAFWRFCYFYSNPVSDDAIRLEAQLKSISRFDQRKKIFLTGSSQAREDFDVDYLNNEMKAANTVFYNFGISGIASPIEMLMIKDRLLAKHPDTIVYVSFVGTFYSDYDVRRMKYFFDPAILPYLIRSVEMKNIITHRHLRTSLIDSFLGMASIFYRYRESMGRIIFASLRHYAHLERRTKPLKYGYKRNKPPTYFEREIRKAKGNRYRPTAYTQLSKYLFTLFAMDVIAKGTKLVVMSGPVHPLIRKCYDERIDISYNEFLSQQADRIGFVYIPESRLPLFAKQEFIDFTHLNALGRGKLSRFFKGYLSEEDNRCNNAALSKAF